MKATDDALGSGTRSTHLTPSLPPVAGGGSSTGVSPRLARGPAVRRDVRASQCAPATVSLSGAALLGAEVKTFDPPPRWSSE